MALIQAKHAVYGVVTVPDTYLRMWPAAYRPVDAPDETGSTEQVTDDSSTTPDEADQEESK